MAAYGNGVQAIISSYFAGVTLKALAVDAFYVQAATDHFVADISVHELTVGGYSRAAVAGVTATFDPGSEIVVVTCNTPLAFGTFAAAASVLGVVLFVDTGDPATSTLVAADLQDYSTDVAADTAFGYQVDSAGGFISFQILTP